MRILIQRWLGAPVLLLSLLRLCNPIPPRPRKNTNQTMVALWIYLCTLLTCAGWLLSALHSLNGIGYLITISIGAGVGWIFRRPLGLDFRPDKVRCRLKRWRRRLFPAAFFCIAGLAILGGIIHPPSNYDGLAYRVPRVLHWLAEGQWHWIHTEFPRMNTRICGIEWVSAPVILFFKTDRFLFVINAVSFALLPGLIFSLLRQLGIRPRVAWYWMWLLPGGYGFLLQAGSISNDMFGAIFALVAVDFALRARRTRQLSAAFVSILSAALLTGAKSSNLPLLLPWLIALLPSWRLLWSKPLGTALVALLAAGASFLPTAFLNLKHCGDWTGLNVESANFQGNRPFLHLSVNAVLLAIQNLAPPIFPLASQWNKLMDATVPDPWTTALEERFEKQGAHFYLGEMQMEEAAGLGCGLTVLVLATIGWRLFHRGKPSISRPGWFTVPGLVIAGSWIAAAVFMSRSGLGPAARYLIPHYVFLIAPFLMGVEVVRLVQMRWWKITALAGAALAALLLVVTPARPLWPAVTLLRAAGAEHSKNPLLRRAWAVYSVYGERADAFAPVRDTLPKDANPLGLVTFDDPETSLWRPFGSRRILHVIKGDTAVDLERRRIQYVLVSFTVLAVHHQTSLEDLLQKLNGEVVQSWTLALRAESGPRVWYLVKTRGIPQQ